jgi:hypothetical protein
MTEFQTRSEETGLEFFDSIEKAMAHAKEDPTVWKISFDHAGEGIRLVRNSRGEFEYRSLKDELVGISQPTECQCDPPCEFSSDWPYCSETAHGCPRMKSQ